MKLTKAQLEFRFPGTSAASARNYREKKQIWNAEDSSRRRRLRPLRSRVNRLMKSLGIPHNRASKGRILWRHSGGWETSSQIYSSPPNVEVTLVDEFRGFIPESSTAKDMPGWWKKTLAALKAEFGERVFFVDRERQRIGIIWHPDFAAEDER